MYGFGETITIVSPTVHGGGRDTPKACPTALLSQSTTENLHANFPNRNRTLDLLDNNREWYFLLLRMVSNESEHAFYFYLIGGMNKTIDDVLRNHITIYDEMKENKEKYIEQVDYLAFYCDQNARETKNPFEEFKYAGNRDNTNRMHTKHENVYAMIDEKQRIFLVYSEGGNAPITILRRAKLGNKRKIDIYGKGLKLYYSGKITRLEDYVKTYQGETQRVDICRDTKEKPNEYICDLGYNKNLEKKGKKVIVETNNERTYRTYGNKNSRIFVRIYDKTQDLKDDKFIHAFLYPEWYKNECRRIETKLTLEYARADTPINRLKMVKRDKPITIKEQNEKIMYKTILLYTIGIAEINVPNIEECIRVLNKARERINNKLKILNNKIPQKGKTIN